MSRKMSKDDLIVNMPLYNIYMVLGDGWYVGNKITRTLKRFSFIYFNYIDVMKYAESIC